MSYLAALNYRYKQEDLEETLFVFDTNYFIYAFQSYSNGDSYIKALENKIDSIYVPFITYIEFLSNINSQTNLLKNDIKILEHYINSVSEKLNVIDIELIGQKIKSESFKTKSKSYDELNNLLKKDIEKIINKYVSESISEIESKCFEIEETLNKKLKEFADSTKDLPSVEEYEKKLENLTQRIDSLFQNPGVIGDMYTQEILSGYISDMEERYSKDIPPGFCDADKGDSEKIFGTLNIPNKAGDLILWKDIINLLQFDTSKKEKFTKVVIVTNDGLSDKKSDWRKKLGKEIIVHEQLKIEFYQKTGKFLDLMKVEEFIEYFSMEDEITKEHIVDEIKTYKKVYQSKEEKINFSLLNNKYSVNNQKEMMEQIFTTVVNVGNLEYKDLKYLPCISTKHEKLTTIFDSYVELTLNEEFDILLGTRLNISDKLRYIHKLFVIAELDPRQLEFQNIKLQKTWQGFFLNIEKLIFVDEIVVTVSTPEKLLGISVVEDIEFYNRGEKIETILTNQIRDKLINFEFHDESIIQKELEFKNIMWNYGYDIENHLVYFERV